MLSSCFPCTRDALASVSVSSSAFLWLPSVAPCSLFCVLNCKRGYMLVTFFSIIS